MEKRMGHVDILVTKRNPRSKQIRNELYKRGVRFYANDNISQYLTKHDKELLIEELTEKFKEVLEILIIDVNSDPNSIDTPSRLAKMYVNELMSGRFESMPDVTSFPNEGDDAYRGMLVIRAEFISMCSHHHQTVKGVAYIGIIPNGRVIGLSKYIRLTQWIARRGTLQEQLCHDIAQAIMKVTKSKDVAVYVQAEHGCCCNRGVNAKSSLTQTTVLHGDFKNPDVKKEFFDNIKIQENQ